MGCVVNGIGESHGADIGVAGGKEKSAVFENGKQIAVVDNCVIEETLMKMITEKTND
jgi:4-hydroxy-3-methylbut-2-en-1-yl diphosphate synthase IspG/GcpE